MDVAITIRTDTGQEWRETRRVSGPLTFGRHAQSVVRLESDLVSRQHVVVEVFAAGLRVEDVSSNGTIAGGVVLKRTAIEVPFGTMITIGNFTVSIEPLAVNAKALARPTLPPNPPKGLAPRAPTAPPAQPARPPHPSRARATEPDLAHIAAAQAAAAAQISVIPIPPPSTVALEKRRDGPPAAASASSIELRREIHRLLLEHLDLATMDTAKLDDPSLRPKVLNAVRKIIKSVEARIAPDVDRDELVGEIVDEALGLGPLERFLSDPTVNEIMVVDAESIYVERAGKLVRTNARFTDDDRVRAVIERIVTPLGRRIDESSPLVDARLKDGSRVNAVIRPVALKGSCITIRKFSRTPLTLEKIIEYGALTAQMARFLSRSVIARKNVIISGGTGSGKTTLLNILSSAIPDDERIITIEDAAELKLEQEHVVAMETRPPNMEGKGEYTIRDLVRNALRMRPDRIVVGECRGGEALDMLQAMNTGHDGSLTTLHANSPREAIARLETLVLMAGMELPVRAIREQIGGSIDLVVQQTRLSDGTRKITAISEVTGIEDDGEVRLVPIFEFSRTGTTTQGGVLGEFRATGYLPTYLDQFIVMGLIEKGGSYL